MVDTIAIQWDTYQPSSEMRCAIRYLNQRSVEELLTELPSPMKHIGKEATFDYRVYTNYPHDEVEKVYVLLNGFAERANTPDAGIKGLLSYLLAKQVDYHKHAVVVIGGLFSFPTKTRIDLLRQGSGALEIVAREVAWLIESRFSSCRAVTVSGYSLGGVMAPLVARAIDRRKSAVVDQICCGEPNYAITSMTKLELLKRVSHASAYRNDQIKATTIKPYITVKKTPSSKGGMVIFRVKQYRPLFRYAPSMRLIAHDLSLQAGDYPPSSAGIQLKEALCYCARKGIRINLLRAEHSSLCHEKPFNELLKLLDREARGKLLLIVVRGAKADHGIEEHRSLSAPFLMIPELYGSPLGTTLLKER